MPDPTQTPAAESRGKLIAKLRELFQLDRGDLDFGLYRIMAMKSGEVEKFLTEHLPLQVEEALEEIAKADIGKLQEERADALRKLRELRVPNPEENEGVKILDAEIAKAKNDKQAEADVYNHLYHFFARYYDEGDFMSLRRYTGGGDSAYLIPYNGEEVKLHWANADQYYIKTTKNYAAYVFTLNGAGGDARRVRFQIARADNEKDNIQETNGRRFVLAGKAALEGGQAVAVEDGCLVIRFEHRPLTEPEKSKWSGNGNHQQQRINADTEKRILEWEGADPKWPAALGKLAPTEANSERTLLGRHLERYTAENSFDYFIHKDLGGFLRREMELYLKSEVLNLDDLAAGDSVRLDRALARMRAVRQVAEKIIVFLAQLENFQKTLWLKKKFVLETNYCVTLDKVPESLYGEIAGNRGQRDEWKELFGMEKLPGKNDAAAFCKAHPFLVVDTRHFDRAFTDKLLAALSEKGGLDAQLDGVLVHGENFQALNLLQARYQGQVKCVYIDPPYNTDSSAILYKNNYKDSSWLAMIQDRFLLAKNLLSDVGVACCAIDDEEAWRLRALMQDLFERELGIAPVRSNPVGRKTTEQFSPSHEYAFFFGREKSMPGTLPKTEKQLQRYPFSDELGNYAWLTLIRQGQGDKREDVPTMFYPIYVGKNDALRIPKMEWDERKREYKILEKPQHGEAVVWPVRDGVEKRWHRGWERVPTEPNEYRVRRSDDGSINIQFKTRMDESATPKTWWGSKDYASANHGARMLKDLFSDKSFDFPKSVKLVEDCVRVSTRSQDALIVDYFAGSGTTAHAVINLNREDDGARKYILVEVGHHFETVLLPRIKKVIYSDNWKDGKPHGANGSSQFVKYIRLESYEDTLDNLERKPLDGPQQALLDANPALAEDYHLRYALTFDTEHNAALMGGKFDDPFQYQLSVVRDGARETKNADIAETFNFLLGLRVSSRRVLDGVLAITGADMRGQTCLILWRKLATMTDDKLDQWLTRHREQFPPQLDIVYVNGDSALNSVHRPGENWTAKAIEPVFRQLMFGGKYDG
ncbi:MAG: site-specific DNA-methyltransferase [Alphaproteobacteria bacterium]|nr:site-specific DNA-methyltransferase [Alphaproteobacteria bacterium]